MKKNVELARKVTRLMISKLPKDKNTFLKVQQFLEVISLLYKKEKDFRNFLINPSVPAEKKLKLIDLIIKKMNQPAEVRSSLEYLISVNAVSVIPEIKRLFEHEIERVMNLSKGKLIVSQRIDKRLINKIAKVVEERVGRKVELDVEEKEDIIGGFILKTHGFVIDASVRRQLEALIGS